MDQYVLEKLIITKMKAKQFIFVAQGHTPYTINEIEKLFEKLSDSQIFDLDKIREHYLETDCHVHPVPGIGEGDPIFDQFKDVSEYFKEFCKRLKPLGMGQNERWLLLVPWTVKSFKEYKDELMARIAVTERKAKREKVGNQISRITQIVAALVALSTFLFNVWKTNIETNGLEGREKEKVESSTIVFQDSLSFQEKYPSLKTDDTIRAIPNISKK